jgi:hypothetical protein
MKRLLVLLLPLLVTFPIMAAACQPGPCPTDDQPSTLVGNHYTGSAGVTTVIGQLYDAGFHDDADLLAGTSVGIAESSLWSQARNWHPEYGCRPTDDAITVQGPDTVWDNTHQTQMHSDRGLWQISSWWYLHNQSNPWLRFSDYITDGLNDDGTANPGRAALAVYFIEKDTNGTGWNEWDTYDSGAAQSHYDAAVDGWPAVRPLVTAFCQTHSCT